MRYKKWLMLVFLCALFVVAPLPVLAAAGDQLNGDYIVTGWNPGSDTSQHPDYQGTMTISAKGSLFEVVWHTGGDTAVTGIGLLRKIGDKWTFSVAYAMQDALGIAVYEVSMTDRGVVLAGQWGGAGGGIGYEVAKRSGASHGDST